MIASLDITKSCADEGSTNTVILDVSGASLATPLFYGPRKTCRKPAANPPQTCRNPAETCRISVGLRESLKKQCFNAFTFPAQVKKLPQTCRKLAANLPQTCRKPAANLPRTCRGPAPKPSVLGRGFAGPPLIPKGRLGLRTAAAAEEKNATTRTVKDESRP